MLRAARLAKSATYLISVNVRQPNIKKNDVWDDFLGK